MLKGEAGCHALISIKHQDAFLDRMAAVKVEMPAMPEAVRRNGGCPHTMPPELRNGGLERKLLGFRMERGCSLPQTCGTWKCCHLVCLARHNFARLGDRLAARVNGFVAGLLLATRMQVLGFISIQPFLSYVRTSALSGRVPVKKRTNESK